MKNFYLIAGGLIISAILFSDRARAGVTQAPASFWEFLNAPRKEVEADVTTENNSLMDNWLYTTSYVGETYPYIHHREDGLH